MNNVINFLDTDSYKVSQHRQYPKGAEYAMSYGEARGGGPQVKFFGLQAILQGIKVPSVEEVLEAKRYCKAHFGRDDVFNLDGWLEVAELGYLPLRVRAVKEGTVVPTKQVLFTVENTQPGFVWLIGWFETKLLRVWYPTSVATVSYILKGLIAGFLEKNGTPESIGFKLHDFGSRGATSMESAKLGGMAHLLNFLGTDTLAGWMGAVEHYDADINSLGFSIAASEHSTITSWGKDFEIDAFANMIEEFGSEGAIYACVSDSYDIWKALDKWKQLEPLILEKGGTLVVRPDSGHQIETPVEVVKGLIERFGFKLNDKGYKVLPDHIRVIQGDGVDYYSIKQILEILDSEEISSDNIAFGMGGALHQKVDRDTFKFAMKMCGIVVDGQERDVYKDPVTDPGKTSKKGFITLTEDFETVRISELGDRKELLVTVWEDGAFVKEYDFDEIRDI